MEKVSLHVEAEINPTESEDKVKKAVENIFDDLTVQMKTLNKKKILVGEADGFESLDELHYLLRRERIRNAARKVFFAGLHGNTISFCLNKQVAYAGHISFCRAEGESPLGPIVVEIKCNNPHALIEMLAPKK